MHNGIVANVSIAIHAPVEAVWDALTNPVIIKQYMFGTNVISDWKEGSPIVWKGEWQGNAYEEKGIILKIEPKRMIRYSHFSPASGKPDVPESHHVVTFQRANSGEQTTILLTQDNNATAEACENSKKNWQLMLKGLRELLEK